MPKSPNAIEQAQRVLAKRLHELKPTGESSFETFLAEALSEFTGQPFFVSKSGPQGGSDVRSHLIIAFGLAWKQSAISRLLSLP